MRFNQAIKRRVAKDIHDITKYEQKKEVQVLSVNHEIICVRQNLSERDIVAQFALLE